MIRPVPAILCIAAAILTTACEKRPDFGATPDKDGKTPEHWHFTGEPDPAKKWQPPSAELDFEKLYSLNCIACHGRRETVGGVTSLDNQTFLNLIPEEALKNTIIHGVKGSRMPAFAESEGGSLTDAQIDILVKGILAWKKPLDPAVPPLPPFAAPLGDAAAGARAVAIYCAACHGADGTGGKTAGSIVNSSYLGLVSDQYLRTIVIVGRPELGMPSPINMRLSDQQVSDITAWLSSHRKNEFGQPLAAPASPDSAATQPVP